ncbi:hypothetical protein LCGC14_1510880 [marine sediment metagenome]|uniref:Uncharacterized protein n=1 Tax=marine sediment metagenome TaxID=412755 RepID=A0A0F9M2L4_9ZZZZ
MESYAGEFLLCIIITVVLLCWCSGVFSSKPKSGSEVDKWTKAKQHQAKSKRFENLTNFDDEYFV